MRPILTFLCLALLAALGCAKTGRPAGGPVDETPPRVVSHTPSADATGVPLNATVEIVFSEAMDQERTREALFISPEVELGVRWRGARLGLELALQADRTYVVTVGTDARDRRANRLEQSHTFAFSTGQQLNRGQISGIVYRDHQPVISAHVWAYDLAESGQPGRTPPQYRTQTGRDGAYAFARLAAGEYRVIAFADDDGDRELDAGEWLSLPAADLSVTEGDTAWAGDLALVGRDSSQARLQRIRALDDRKLLLQFSAAVAANELEMALEGVAVEEVYASSEDPRKVYVRTGPQVDGREYGVEHLRVRGQKLVWDGTVRGSGRPDRTPPRLVAQRPAGAMVAASDTLRLVFDDAMDRAMLPHWSQGDSVTMPPPAGSWSWQGPLTLAFVARDPFAPGDYRLSADLTGLLDRAGLASRDSVAAFRFVVPDADELATVQGQVSGPGAVTVVASSSTRTRATQPDSAGSFLFSGLLPGSYVLHAFADPDGDGYRSVGQLEPFQHAEPYTRWPETVELRAGDRAVVGPRVCR